MKLIRAKNFLPVVKLVATLMVIIWAVNVFEKWRHSAWRQIKNPETVQMLQQFIAAKKTQAYTSTDGVPREIQKLFKLAERGDWLTFSNAFRNLGERNGYFYVEPPQHGEFWTRIEEFVAATKTKIGWRTDPDAENRRLRGASWDAVAEVWVAFNAFATGDEKNPVQFGREIIGSIPRGGILFAGTDSGRTVVNVMGKLPPDDGPFFTLNQNKLVDKSYLDDLHSIYGGNIDCVTPKDVDACIEEYRQYAWTNALLGGTNIDYYEPAAFAISGRLMKLICERETNREIFYEENYAMQWLYPQIEPYGLIFKINRQPLSELSDEIVRRDRDYWCKSLVPKIGGWLTNETTFATVAAFVKKTFVIRDYAGFSGDKRFVQNEYVCKMFSKERSSIAGLYAWRAGHSTNELEKKRMTVAADFAFRQAWALCPYSSEAVYRYINFLLAQNRFEEALLVAETTAGLPQLRDDYYMKKLPADLKAWSKEHPPKP